MVKQTLITAKVRSLSEVAYYFVIYFRMMIYSYTVLWFGDLNENEYLFVSPKKYEKTINLKIHKTF